MKDITDLTKMEVLVAEYAEMLTNMLPTTRERKTALLSLLHIQSYWPWGYDLLDKYHFLRTLCSLNRCVLCNVYCG